MTKPEPLTADHAKALDTANVMKGERFACGIGEGPTPFGNLAMAYLELHATISRLTLENERLREALKQTRTELWYCADQLKARGVRHVEGDSVDRALKAADAILRPAPEAKGD